MVPLYVAHWFGLDGGRVATSGYTIITVNGLGTTGSVQRERKKMSCIGMLEISALKLGSSL